MDKIHEGITKKNNKSIKSYKTISVIISEL